MKRLLCVSFFLALTAVLTGCGESTGKADNASTPTTQKVTEEADTTAEPGTYEPLATVRERDIVSNEIYDY